MKNFVQPGDVITCTAPAGGVVGGLLYQIGLMFGVAAASKPAGSKFELQTGGVFEFAKKTGEAWTEGQAVYWDPTAKNMTTTAGSLTKVGVSVGNYITTAGAASVRLNKSF